MNPPLEQTVKQLEQQLDEVRGENEKLRKDHGEYVLGKATLMDLAVRNGSLTASMGTEMAHIWAEQFHSVLESTKAENYVECMFNTKDGKIITVTVQRHEKKTPHQFRMELETTVETLRQQLKEKDEALEAIIKEQPCLDGGGCFYPMHDGDGNYIGEQNIDPLLVIQRMVEIAQSALNIKGDE